MNCDHVMFTGHAVQRMFERRIQKEQIRDLLQSGEVIAEYPNDVPLPSSLLTNPILVSGPMTLGRGDHNEMSYL